MTSVNSPGFIFLALNLRCFKNSVISKVALRGCLIERSLYFKPAGGEYEELNPFFTSIGISHHVYCSHAHQQNGSAERNHRYIVDEEGLSLLSHASMPLFLATTFLINQTASKVIGFDTPLEV